MNLIVDIGNTLVKYAVFDQGIANVYDQVHLSKVGNWKKIPGFLGALVCKS